MLVEIAVGPVVGEIPLLGTRAIAALIGTLVLGGLLISHVEMMRRGIRWRRDG